VCYAYLSSYVEGDLNTILIFLEKFTSAGFEALRDDAVDVVNSVSVDLKPSISYILNSAGSFCIKNYIAADAETLTIPYDTPNVKVTEASANTLALM